VDGTLGRSYSATGAYTYFVGQNGYSPVAATITTLTVNPSTLTVQSFDASLVGLDPTKSISRNWLLLEGGDLTATLSFTYFTDAADVPGTATEANFRVFRRESSGTITDMCGAACINTGTNTAGPVAGVTTFSRWGVGEIPPTAANVNVGGRVTFADGISGVPGATVTIAGGSLQHPITLRANPFGYYNFENIPVGTYVLTVGAKQYTFMNPTIVIDATDNVTTANFFVNP
jgi:hypothetical protein